MKVPKIAQAMEYLEDAWIEDAADNLPDGGKRRPVRWWLVAACIGLLLGCVTAVAVSDWGTRVVEFFTDRQLGEDYRESGYTLELQIEKIPVNTLKGQVREVEDTIRWQIKNYKPYDSWSPTYWQRVFPFREDACEFVGLARLWTLNWGLAEERTTLAVNGDAQGALAYLCIETWYTEGDIRLQFFTRIYTENYTEALTIGAVTTESMAFTEDFYTSASGRRCHVIRSSAMESGRMTMSGYLVAEGILYNLHLSYPEADAQRAEQLLYGWAELF